MFWKRLMRLIIFLWKDMAIPLLCHYASIHVPSGAPQFMFPICFYYQLKTLPLWYQSMNYFSHSIRNALNNFYSLIVFKLTEIAWLACWWLRWRRNCEPKRSRCRSARRRPPSRARRDKTNSWSRIRQSAHRLMPRVLPCPLLCSMPSGEPSVLSACGC